MKIISGGQTGADLGGLEGAKFAGAETGGMAPLGYRTEKGSNLELKNLFDLVESPKANYNHRTTENVKNSDITLIFADQVTSAGTKLTIETCQKYGKAYLINPTVEHIKLLVKNSPNIVINVAGNRESVAPGIQKRVRLIIFEALK